jgi:hypothetical protein
VLIVAVVVLDKPAKGSIDASIDLALGEVGVLSGGADECHCFVSFYVLKVADSRRSARFIFDFLLFLRSGHRESRQAHDQ